MKYYRDVVCPKKESGDIVCCELQKPYELQPSFTHDEFKFQPRKYVADFFIVYKDGREEVSDTKGYADTTATVSYTHLDVYKIQQSTHMAEIRSMLTDARVELRKMVRDYGYVHNSYIERE